MIQACFAGITIDSSKIMLSVFSISLAILIIFLLKKFNFSNKSKIGLMYSHLVFLFYPLVLLTTQTTCGLLCISTCYNSPNSMANLMLLSLPTTLLISTIVGSFAIPLYYIKTNKQRQIESGWIFNFVRKHSKTLNIKQPKIFAIDKANPLAFSFRYFKSAVFLSVGLFDILSKKELEAVILHELAHVREKTSALKLSLSFFRIFSPASLIVKFHHERVNEERKADKVASSMQKTNKYVKSARSKIQKYDSVKYLNL